MRPACVITLAALGALFIVAGALPARAQEEREEWQPPLRGPSSSVSAHEAPRKIDIWDLKLSLGANARRGNSDQIEATALAELVRSNAKDRVALDYIASFNETDFLQELELFLGLRAFG